ncbi:MAG: type II toxin-antitoxin system RelE/ParE family toxin [Dethiobacteria bacterium]|jgi:toxin ParE1/3/4
MYKIKYLPLAQNDLKEIINHISDTLKAPQAAKNLVNAFDTSISRLAQFPYSCRVYQPIKPIETEYRILPVKNYLVFYVVIEYKVEIHRIVYAKMNLEKLIK